MLRFSYVMEITFIINIYKFIASFYEETFRKYGDLWKNVWYRSYAAYTLHNKKEQEPLCLIIYAKKSLTSTRFLTAQALVKFVNCNH